MVRDFRVISKDHTVRDNDAVLFVTRLEDEVRACLLLPPHTGEVRVSEFHSLEDAVALAKETAEEHDLDLAVLLDDEADVHWRKEWRALFGPVH
jgi:hypothetical protein